MSEFRFIRYLEDYDVARLVLSRPPLAIEEHLGTGVKEMLEGFHDLFHRLRALECVKLAAVHGATLGQPEIKVGVFPPIAALHYPRRIGLGRTLSLLLSGEVIGAAEAERIGLVDKVVPADRLADAVESQLAHFRAQSAAVLRLTRRAVIEASGMPFDAGLAALEDLYRYELMATEDAAEGLRAFLEKRKPVWRDR
jgi:cyclohexa-1,5-dienecarbonyl-CoA hydratase